MRKLITVNYVAVLIAGVVSMGVGFLWYSPFILGKPWMKLMGLSSESMKAAQKEMGKMYALSFVATLLTGFVLSHIMSLSKSFYGFAPVSTGLTSAFWVWLGFVAPVQLTDMIFGSKKWQLFAINTGYQLASLLAMGIVLGMM